MNIPGYSEPSRFRPRWHVAALVFRGGQTLLPPASLTGSGFIYGRDVGGAFQPVVVQYATPTQSTVGGGTVPARPSFLTRLLGQSNQATQT